MGFKCTLGVNVKSSSGVSAQKVAVKRAGRILWAVMDERSEAGLGKADAKSVCLEQSRCVLLF